MGNQLMSNPIIVIHNVQTGEIVEREMTQAEFDERAAAEAATLEAEAQKAADKAALLAKLGITAEEAKLLLS